MFFYIVKPKTELALLFSKYQTLKHKSEKQYKSLQQMLKFKESYRYANFLVGGYTGFTKPLALTEKMIDKNFTKISEIKFVPSNGLAKSKYDKLISLSMEHDYFCSLISGEKFKICSIQFNRCHGFVSDSLIQNSDLKEVSLIEYQQQFTDYEL